MRKYIILFCILLTYSGACFSADWIPARRKDQNPTQPAHLVVPLPYSKPGIGKGVVLLGTMTNVAGTTADISGLLVGGDASGAILNGSEIPLYSDHLFMNFYLQRINRAAVNNYSIRGIGNTTKDDYNILDVGLANENKVELNLTYFDRRLNFYYAYNDFKYQIDAIKDHNGVLLTTLNQSFVNSGDSQSLRVLLDLTDDYLDARKGVRIGLGYQKHQASSLKDPEFYTLDLNLLGYIPIGKADTLVLNYFQSDAHVQRIGDTNPADIRAELNSNCAPTDTACLDAEQALVDNFISARTNGTSTSLGGDLRLRSFPQSRYQGAHTAFVGAEYRWNINEEAKPFDYFIWKDVRTGLQVAFFAELGSVSETASQLWHETRYSVGTGLRLIAGSGAVYRADVATGSEGTEVIVIFNYPWDQ